MTLKLTPKKLFLHVFQSMKARKMHQSSCVFSPFLRHFTYILLQIVKFFRMTGVSLQCLKTCMY